MRLTLFPLLLTFSTTHATDLLVAIGGSGNVYPTITSALAAAVANDRILVNPGTYNENVTITKNVEVLSNVSGQRYTVNGDIAFAPASANCKATVMDALVLDSIKTGSITGTGHTFTVIGCKTNNYSCPTELVATRLLRDSIMGTAQMYPPADVIGCYISGVATANYFPLIISTLSTVQNSKRSRIIGNVIGTSTTSNYLLLGIGSTSPFDIQNNYFMVPGPALPSHVVYVANALAAGSITTAPCTVHNNTFRCPAALTIAAIQVMEDDPALSIDIRNNYLVGPFSINSAAPSTTTGSNITTPTLSHVNAATGAPTLGSPGINAGDPEVIYTDLDLSRNDAGCHGGSFSRDNFDDPLPNTAVVAFVNAPRRTQAALAIPVSADGFDH